MPFNPPARYTLPVPSDAIRNPERTVKKPVGFQAASAVPEASYFTTKALLFVDVNVLNIAPFACNTFAVVPLATVMSPHATTPPDPSGVTPLKLHSEAPEIHVAHNTFPVALYRPNHAEDPTTLNVAPATPAESYKTISEALPLPDEPHTYAPAAPSEAMPRVVTLHPSDRTLAAHATSPSDVYFAIGEPVILVVLHGNDVATPLLLYTGKLVAFLLTYALTNTFPSRSAILPPEFVGEVNASIPAIHTGVPFWYLAINGVVLKFGPTNVDVPCAL